MLLELNLTTGTRDSFRVRKRFIYLQFVQDLMNFDGKRSNQKKREVPDTARTATGSNASRDRESVRDSSFSFGPSFGDLVEVLAGVGKVDILLDDADLV